jgi:hypothetical protein
MASRATRRGITPFPRETASEKRFAIVVPVKDRDAYLEVFLDAVPRYVREVNGLHEFKIFVAEQVDDVPFNASLARNVGARFALHEDDYDYLIFHDVDLIPVAHVDYGYRDVNVGWFMNTGTCKIHIDALRAANGYNPSVWGWCSEDTEFYSRIIDAGHVIKAWHQMPEAQGAVIVNLDLEPQAHEACLEHSKRYFGHDGEGPLHISYNLTDTIRPRSQVVSRGGRMENWHFERLSTRHREIIDFLMSMPPKIKRTYASLYGMNWVNRDKVTVVTDTRELCHVRYRWFDVVD